MFSIVFYKNVRLLKNILRHGENIHLFNYLDELKPCLINKNVSIKLSFKH